MIWIEHDCVYSDFALFMQFRILFDFQARYFSSHEFVFSSLCRRVEAHTASHCHFNLHGKSGQTKNISDFVH